MDLSILCVTQAAPSVRHLLFEMEHLANQLAAEMVFVADGQGALRWLERTSVTAKIVPVTSLGYLESALEHGVMSCSRDYVLRLDDDEKCSAAMETWLSDRSFHAADHWKFPRVHLWRDTRTALVAPPLFPDHQTRLSIREKSGGRHGIHAPSPFGGGEEAPVAIEHHKFLVKSRADRELTARKWHRGDMTAFSLPETVLRNVELVDKGDGFVPWTPRWVTHVEAL